MPIPIHGGYAHIADVGKVHLKAALLDSKQQTDFGVSSPVDYGIAFAAVAKVFPKAVEEGIFAPGSINTLPISWDPSASESQVSLKLHSFESAVLDVARQYLEVLGKAKA